MDGCGIKTSCKYCTKSTKFYLSMPTRMTRFIIMPMFVLMLVSSLTLPAVWCEPLDDYILDYQPLTFDTGHIHSQHQRAKRSVDGNLRLNFHAYNRNFKLRLKRDASIFEPGHMTVGDNGRLQVVDTSFIYSGYLEGVPKSFAHISLIDGVARGYVDVPGDTTYHIDAAQQYFNDSSFHAVIYPESRMNKDPFRHKREADDLGSCGMDRVKEWMETMSKSSVDKVLDHARHKRSERRPSHSDTESSYSKYYAPEPEDKDNDKDDDSAKKDGRKKRATLGQNNTCFLYLRSDPMMWNFIKHQKFKTNLSDERSKEEILAFFASHVSALKNIFHRTIFTTYSGDLRFTGVNFVVQRTSIMTPRNQKCGHVDESSYCNPNIDVSNFLNLNSMDQHDEFCLAYIFTHRDFTRGTLGLAWVGAREVASGGICEKHKSYLENKETVPKSLNTGIVTTVNYGKAVPARVSQLTFTHEVGHNFGSPHDLGTQCAPFGSDESNAQDGNFIMFASATMGDRPNNDDFSICSKDNITRLLKVVVNKLNGKRNCFKPSKTAFCGNGIKEENEECDCGYSLDCEDSCCFGRDSQQGTQCTLKPGKDCSPTAGPCCSTNCEYVTEGANVQCLPADECRRSAYCKGKSAECPLPVLQDNGTSCNGDAQMCYNGECVKSVCGKINWEECFLTSSENDDGPSREALCYVSCTNPKTGMCVSSFDKKAIALNENAAFFKLLQDVAVKRTGKPVVLEPNGIQLPAGSPCDNFKGYCDVFHRCRGVDADGPLARLKNLIFDPETLENIQLWVVEHWWAVMLMAMSLIVVMAVFIKVCAVHTPSSNPRKPKHRQLTLPRTLQRRHHRGGGQGAGQRQRRRAGPRSIDPPSSSSGNPGNGGARNKPVTSSTVMIEQEPPPPYSSSVSNQSSSSQVSRPNDVIPAPSSSPAAPMIEPVGAPDLSNIPAGGPKRGRGGGRMKGVGAGAAIQPDIKSGKKGGKKSAMEMKML